MIAENIIKWLNTCPYISMLDMSQTSIDGQGLYKEPGLVVEDLLDGSQIRTESFYILFMQDSKLKKERVNNAGLLENLERWVLLQDIDGNYPDIGYDVDSVKISNGYYIVDQDNNEATYQATLSIKYYIDIEKLKEV